MAKRTTAKSIPVNDSAGVDAYMLALEHPLKAEIEALRSIIIKADKNVCERVKWNAPSFFYVANNEAKDIAAFHVRETKLVHVVLVYPEGVSISDPDGILEGEYKDRRMLKLASMSEIKAKGKAVKRVISEWISSMKQHANIS